ncbi:MAG: thiamine-phosphate kinase [Acidobacteria bacterium]|nr:thiamine-phosphate kinase [Acidobacteriota bacterium]
MDLSRLGEAGFVDALVRRHRRAFLPPPHGPGDDAAVLGRSLVTTDALIEDVHFRATEPPFLIGRKSLAVNLSDIAAMGGRPEAFVVALGLPSGLPARFLRALVDGLADGAAEAGVRWIGGDTVRSPRGVVIAITAIGRRGRRILTRQGARPGDGVYVSGPLGASAAGRLLLEAGFSWNPAGAAGPPGRRIDPAARREAAELLRAHLDPRPRLAAGWFLASKGVASAATDLSDGLSVDLRRLCHASGVGARIEREAIPVSQATRAWARRRRRDALDLALHGGEDYELLFTVPRRREPLLARWPKDSGAGPLLIGRITARRQGLRIARPDGRTEPIPPLGYDPFRPGRRVDTP